MYGNCVIIKNNMETGRPRKTLPIEVPTHGDHIRWWNPNIILTPEDRAWKEAWEVHSRRLFQRFKITPISSTTSSWIDTDLTFILRLSEIYQ